MNLYHPARQAEKFPYANFWKYDFKNVSLASLTGSNTCPKPVKLKDYARGAIEIQSLRNEFVMIPL